jgi:hypothetical protein
MGGKGMSEWRKVPDTNIEVSGDGALFRWTFDRDGAEFIASELYPDRVGRDIYRALDAADEIQRVLNDEERFGISIVMVAR